MSLADAYADAHLDLSTLDVDIDQAAAKLEQAVSRWERIANVRANVDLETDRATTELDAAVTRWNRMADVAGSVDLDTAAATDDLTSAILVWRRAVQVSGSVDLDTEGATADLLAAAAEWQAIANGVDGRVTMSVDGDQSAALRAAADSIRDALTVKDTDTKSNVHALLTDMWTLTDLTGRMNSQLADTGRHFGRIGDHATTVGSQLAQVTSQLNEATDAASALGDAMQVVSSSADGEGLTRSMREWEALASRGVHVEVHLDTSGADGELVASIAAWNAGLSDGLVGDVDLDTGAATDHLTAALLVWQRALALSGTVDIDTTEATARLAGTVAEWKTVLDDVEVTIKVSTEGDGAEGLLLRVSQWQALVADGVTVRIDMDTTEATAQLGIAVDEWDVVIRQGLSTGVDIDTFAATEQLGVAVDEWAAVLEQGLSTGVEMDTAAATEQLRTAIDEWRVLVARKLDVTVDMDTAAATADLEEASAVWRATLAENPTVAVEMDTAAATSELDASVTGWRATLAGDLTAKVDLDTAAATTQLGVVADEWGAVLDAGFSARVDMDTAAATAELEAAIARWKEMASFTSTVRVRVEDPDSLDNLAATFLGLKPLLDLPVRFHIDQDSIAKVTAEIQSVAELWSAQTNVDVNIRPTGSNDLPDRSPRRGTPAQPRAPDDTFEPVIRPQIDGSEAKVQAELLERILHATLEVTADVGLNGDEALAYAETLSPLVEDLLRTSMDVKLDGVGAIEYAADLRALIEQILSDISFRAELTGTDEAVSKLAALSELAERVAAITIPVDVDDDTAIAEAMASVAAINAAIDSIVVPASVDFDTTRAAADAKVVERLIREVAKVTIPVNLSTGEAIAESEALGPLISRLLDITAKPTLDADGLVAEAAAIDALLERAINVTVPIDADFDSTATVAKAAALQQTLEGILRDIVVKANLEGGGEMTAEAVVIQESLERAIGTIEARVDLDTGMATAEALAWNQKMDALFDGWGKNATAKFGKVFGSMGSSMTSAFTGAFGGVAKFSAMAVAGIEIVAAAFAAIQGVVAGLVAGVWALVDALGALIGLAGGFATLAGGIGLAAAAAGALGVALNKDLLNQAKEGLSALKDGVAAATRDAGRDLLDKYQKPFVDTFTSIAAHAAKLTPLLVDPIADAGLRITGVFDRILASDLGANIASKVGSGIGEFIDQFAAYLPAYAEMFDSVVGKSSGIQDFVTAILELGLKAGPLFVSLGDLLSALSESLVGFGDVGIPIVTRLSDALTKLFRSDLFDSFLSLGAAVLGMLGDMWTQMSKAAQATGLQDTFAMIAGAFKEIVDSGAFAEIGKLIGSLLRLGSQVLGPLVTTIGKVAGSVADFIEPLVPVLGQFADVIGGALAGAISQLLDGLSSVDLAGVFATIGEAVRGLVDSGAMETLGEIIGKLLELGADMLGPLLNLLAPVAEALMAFLEPLIPVIETFVDVLATQLGEVIQDWVDDGVFEQLANALGSIINLFTLMIPGIAELVKLLGGPLAKGLQFVAFLFGDLIPRAVTFAAQAFAGLMGIVSKVAGAVLSELGSIARKVVGWFDWALPEDASRALKNLTQTTADFGGAADITGKVLTNVIVPQIGKLGAEWYNASSAGDAARLVADEFGIASERAAKITDRYNDRLGEGAKVLGEYAVQSGLTAKQVDEAAVAAENAAGMFTNTTALIGEMRDMASKPIELAFDFDKTKLNLDELVGYVAGQIKTVKEEASKPIADPTTEAMAKNVVGADGSTLDSTTSKAVEQYVPEHLDRSIADATTEMLENATRDINNHKYLEELRWNGASALADQLKQFDGPKLALAIKELGDAGSKAVLEANRKIEEAQKIKDQGFNPLQAAIDDQKKTVILKTRQAEIVAELEAAWAKNGGQDPSQLAANFAKLKPEDLEAAIRTYESLSPEAIGTMELQLVQIQQALTESAERIDPLGKMFDAIRNTPGAREGLSGSILSPEELAVATGDFGQGFFGNIYAQLGVGLSQDQRKFKSKVDRVEQILSGKIPKGATPEEVARWAAVDSGKDAQGNAITDTTGEEAKVLAAIAARKAAHGNLPAKVAEEAKKAGAAETSAYADGIAEQGDQAEKAANDVAARTVQATQKTIEAAAADLAETGAAFAKLLATGVKIGVVVNLIPAIFEMFGLVVRMIERIAGDRSIVGSGAAIPRGIVTGVKVEAITLYAAVAVMMARVARLLSDGADDMTGRLTAIGVSIAGHIETGFDVGTVTLLVTIAGLGARIAVMLRAAQAVAVVQAKATGAAIGDAIGEGLSESIAALNLASDQTGTGGTVGQGANIVGRAAGAAVRSAEGQATQKGTDSPGFSLGTALIDGMILGMYARLPQLVQATQAIATMLGAIMRTALGVRSPSTVTKTIGEQVVDGLAAGIEGSNDRAVTAARRLADRVSGALNEGIRIDQPDLSGVDTTEHRLWAAVAAPPPSILMPAQPDLYGAASAAPTSASTSTGNSASTPTPQEASASARSSSSGPYIHADVINVNGVPGAEQIPERTDNELWRLGYGESPRRRTW